MKNQLSCFVFMERENVGGDFNKGLYFLKWFVQQSQLKVLLYSYLVLFAIIIRCGFKKMFI